MSRGFSLSIHVTALPQFEFTLVTRAPSLKHHGDHSPLSSLVESVYVTRHPMAWLRPLWDFLFYMGEHFYVIHRRRSCSYRWV